ncbi:MAG: cation:proton antiporter [Aquificae bacterium]|nr:cation:proton antiporter [Aquificota bacterium]
MEVDFHSIFLVLFLIFFFSRTFAEIFSRFGIPPVLGEISAGLLLGPTALGWVEPNQLIKILAEIGIVLLLFQVGLETDVNKLKRAGLKSVIVAVFGAVIPFSLGFLVSYFFFNVELLPALFIGGTLTATSIGITLRVLKDLGKERSGVAQVVLGAAVIDDIIGVILLVFIYDFAITGQINIYQILKISFFIFVFLVVAPFVAYIFSHIFAKLEKQSRLPGFIPTVIISLILLFAYLSHAFGAPEILGSFAAGIALSRRFIIPFAAAMKLEEHFLEKVERQMNPIIYTFTPIFFVMVGLSINLREINFASTFFWIFGLVLLLIAVFGKIIGSYLIPRTKLYRKTLIGVSMVPRGEVGLIFAELGRTQGILQAEVYAVLLFVIIVTTLVPPFLLKHLFEKFEGVKT